MAGGKEPAPKLRSVAVSVPDGKEAVPLFELASAPAQAQVIVDQVVDYFASGRLDGVISPSMVVFDVGANIGTFALECLRRTGGRAGAIYCFEPVPSTRHCLDANVRRLLDPATPLKDAGTTVRVQPYGLGREATSIEFDFRPHAPACSSMMADVAPAGTEDKQKEQVDRILAMMRDASYDDVWAKGRPRMASLVRNLVPTPVLRAGVSTWCSYYNKVEKVNCELKTIWGVMESENVAQIDLLKVDVEGAEEEVLAGMADGLDGDGGDYNQCLAERWERVRAIVAEVHDVNGRLDRMRGLLEGVGFAVAVEKEKVFDGVDIYNLLATRA